MSEVIFYSCDICGKHFEKMPKYYFNVWEGYDKKERFIQHVCDDCYKQFADLYKSLRLSREEKVTFTHE